MNRNEEYQALLAELESVPLALETTVDRAVKRLPGTAGGCWASRWGVWPPALQFLCCW